MYLFVQLIVVTISVQVFVTVFSAFI